MSMFFASLAAPSLALAATVFPLDTFAQLADDPNAVAFYACEFDVYQPASGSFEYALPHLSKPNLALSLEPQLIEDYVRQYVASVPYRSKTTDSIGTKFFAPLMRPDFTYDKAINLSPLAHAVGAYWGTLALENPRQGATARGYWDDLVINYNVQARRVAIRVGAKPYERLRGLHTDPSYDDLFTVFNGIADSWDLGLGVLTLNLRDQSYFLEKPIQSEIFAGTGTYEGTAELTGLPKPMTRGGTASFPVRNVTPVLIDPTNLIYQYSDGPGTVQDLYERGYAGAGGIVFQADTADLYSGSTDPGKYRTDNSRSLFQLGSSPAGEITCDVTGEFPSAGAISNVIDLGRYAITDDADLPSDFISTADFIGCAAAYDYTAGYYIGPEVRSVVDVVSAILGSVNGRLTVNASGQLRPYVLTSADNAFVRATYTTREIRSVTPQSLPDLLRSPPWRWRVGFARNHTLQTSDLSASVSNARRQYLAKQFTHAVWSDSDILAQYRRPTDAPEVASVLLEETDAQAVADALGALWGQRRQLYRMEAVLDVLQHEIGDVIIVQFPLDNLNDGRAGVVVGVSARGADNSTSLLVLV